MINRIVLKEVLLKAIMTFFQLAITIIIYTYINSIYPVQIMDIGFGISIYYSTIFFSFSLLIFNIFSVFIKRFLFISGMILFLLSSFFLFQLINYRPKRVLFVIFCFLFNFCVSYLIVKIRGNKQKLSKQ